MLLRLVQTRRQAAGAALLEALRHCSPGRVAAVRRAAEAGKVPYFSGRDCAATRILGFGGIGPPSGWAELSYSYHVLAASDAERMTRLVGICRQVEAERLASTVAAPASRGFKRIFGGLIPLPSISLATIQFYALRARAAARAVVQSSVHRLRRALA